MERAEGSARLRSTAPLLYCSTTSERPGLRRGLRNGRVRHACANVPVFGTSWPRSAIHTPSGGAENTFSGRTGGRVAEGTGLLNLRSALQINDLRAGLPPRLPRAPLRPRTRAPAIHATSQAVRFHGTGHAPQLARSFSRSGTAMPPPSKSHVVPGVCGPPQAPSNASRSGIATTPAQRCCHRRRYRASPARAGTRNQRTADWHRCCHHPTSA